MNAAPRYVIEGPSPDGSSRAKDSHLDRSVTLKPWWAAADRERLRSLILVLRDLQSKHLADVYDLVDFAHGSRVAVVEEHIEGESLSEWESAAPAGEAGVLRLLLQMTGALAALHSRQLSPPSLDPILWRFDIEGILNLSVFSPPSGNGRPPGVPATLTPSRAAADLRSLATHAKRIATRHLATAGVTARSLADPILANLWSGVPKADSDPAILYRRLQSFLLRDQHRAVVIYRGTLSEVNAARRTLKLAHPNPSVAQATIHYDGIEFSLMSSTGEVFLNNTPFTGPVSISGSCVITLGSPHRKWNERHFITLDASHPEVVL